MRKFKSQKEFKENIEIGDIVEFNAPPYKTIEVVVGKNKRESYISTFILYSNEKYLQDMTFDIISYSQFEYISKFEKI